MKANDRIGQIFGKLTIISIAGVNSSGKTIFNCLCSCGQSSDVSGDNLFRKNKSTKSCGCLIGHNTFAFNYNPWAAEYRRWIKVNTITRNIINKLTEEQWTELSKGNCYFCGNEPNQPCHNGQKVLKNGIDRLNSDIGYTPENCVPCCSQCNYAKHTTPVDEFLAWVRRVYVHQLPRAS